MIVLIWHFSRPPFFPTYITQSNLAFLVQTFICDATLSGMLATTSGGFQLSDVFVYFQATFIPSCCYIRLVLGALFLSCQTFLATLRPASRPAAAGSQPPVNPPRAPSLPQLHTPSYLLPHALTGNPHETPTQRDITTDHLHVLHHALNRFPHSSTGTP